MKQHTTWLILLSLSLVACGGGGDGGGNTTSPSPSSSSSSRSLNELVIASDNDLSSTYQLTVDVNLTQLAGKEVYIVICENNSETIDYNKCFVKASLDDGVGIFELRLPNHQQSLIAEISPMEANSSPLTFIWQYDNQAQSIWLIP
ncbi:hypothetical protein L4C38_16825 [Vibrio kasasachensis]|uniref:hypothetical protein n=1 Tax=Vibrio kasasachensis TaxID=2910248 RepID=UPI003D140004